MNLYLDASALVKRYVRQTGSETVRQLMAEADGLFIGRFGYVEVFRAVSLAAGARAARTFVKEWPAFGVLEVTPAMAERAGVLAVEHGLRSLDALHLAAALIMPPAGLTFLTWNGRLGQAARQAGISVAPADLIPPP